MLQDFIQGLLSILPSSPYQISQGALECVTQCKNRCPATLLLPCEQINTIFQGIMSSLSQAELGLAAIRFLYSNYNKEEPYSSLSIYSPKILEFITTLNGDLLNMALSDLLRFLNTSAIFFSQSLPIISQFLLSILTPNFSETTRQIAIDSLIQLSRCYSTEFANNNLHLPIFQQIIITLAEIDLDSIGYRTMQIGTIFFESENFIPLSLQFLFEISQRPEWPLRAASISAIDIFVSECSDKFSDEQIEQILSVIVCHFEDEQPEVRCEYLRAFAQLSIDFSPKLQIIHHEDILQSLMTSLSKEVHPFACFKAAIAMNSFYDNCPLEIKQKIGPSLLQWLVQYCGQCDQSIMVILASTMASLSRITKQPFTPYSNFAGSFKTLLVSTDSSILRTKIFRSFVRIGLTVPDLFQEDASQLVQFIITQTTEEEHKAAFETLCALSRAFPQVILANLEPVVGFVFSIATKEIEMQELFYECDLSSFTTQYSIKYVPEEQKVLCYSREDCQIKSSALLALETILRINNPAIVQIIKPVIDTITPLVESTIWPPLQLQAINCLRAVFFTVRKFVTDQLSGISQWLFDTLDGPILNLSYSVMPACYNIQSHLIPHLSLTPEFLEQTKSNISGILVFCTQSISNAQSNLAKSYFDQIELAIGELVMSICRTTNGGALPVFSSLIQDQYTTFSFYMKGMLGERLPIYKLATLNQMAYIQAGFLSYWDQPGDDFDLDLADNLAQHLNASVDRSSQFAVDGALIAMASFMVHSDHPPLMKHLLPWLESLPIRHETHEVIAVFNCICVLFEQMNQSLMTPQCIGPAFTAVLEIIDSEYADGTLLVRLKAALVKINQVPQLQPMIELGMLALDPIQHLKLLQFMNN